MVCPQFRPITGGYEKAAERLSSELASQGHYVEVFTERRERKWKGREEYSGFVISRWWCIHKRNVHSATSIAGLAWLLLKKGWRFDVWHVHQYGIHLSLCVLLGAILGKPVVVKTTNTEADGISATLGKGILSKATRFLARRVSRVIALTEETASEAIEFGIPPERVRVIGNGVSDDAFSAQTTKINPLGFGTRTQTVRFVITVCRLVPQKNLSLLLNAWKKVVSIVDDWHLIVVGDGPLMISLTEMTKDLELSDFVHFAGHQGNITEWLRSAEVFVQSSNYEGLSNTMLEAMAAGIPVVVTAVSGTKELVEQAKTGIRVPVRDSQALADALIRLIRNRDEREAIGARAREFVKCNFTIRRIAALHLALYNEIST